MALLAPVGDDGFAVWEEAAIKLVDPSRSWTAVPDRAQKFAAVPTAATRKQSAEAWRKTLTAHLYQNVTMDLMTCPADEADLQAGRERGRLQARVAQTLRERRDVEVTKLKTKYAPKLQTLATSCGAPGAGGAREGPGRSAEGSDGAERGRDHAGGADGPRMASASNLGRATSTMRSASKIGKERPTWSARASPWPFCRSAAPRMEAQFEQESGGPAGPVRARAAGITKAQVRPRKSDIMIGQVGLCWTPWKKGADGMVEPA
jgi:hypothetical protein